ncbi:hypothetical protein E3N88_21507 [Mikania micrantha]|uniref:Pectinesterase inhibitor domain-containing protein n=1 Tax=Mikania micrantha TaxID=192012 RepID=A0A5N6NKF1_9ASTR|nr:hypothetical protein E3N88_21507 [Mikania micrantha]
MINKRKKLLVFASSSSIILLSVLIVIGVVCRRNSSSGRPESSATAHAIVKSACSSTSYPELCYSTITSHPEIKKVMSTRKASLTQREVRALHDCLEMVSETLEAHPS